MEGSGSQLASIGNLFKKKEVQIIWFACLENYKSIRELNVDWGTHPRLLYKTHRKMYKLNLIDEKLLDLSEKDGKKSPSFKIKSRVEWLREVFECLVKEDIYTEELKKIFGSLDSAVNNVVEVTDSEAFRKGVMDLNFFKTEIKRYNEMKLGSPQIFYGHSLRKLEKGIFFPNWTELVINRLAYLSLFKAFEDDRCLNLFKSESHILKHQFFNSTPAFTVTDLLSLHKNFSQKYKVPEAIKPYFTFDDIVALMEYYLEHFKSACPDALVKANKRIKKHSKTE